MERPLALTARSYRLRSSSMIRRPSAPSANADRQAERERAKRQKMLNVRMGRPDEPVLPAEPLWSIDRELAKMEAEAASISDEARIGPRPARPYNLGVVGLESLRASIRRRFPKPSKYALLLMSQMRPARPLKSQRTKVTPRRVVDGAKTPRTPRARRDAASVQLILDRLRKDPVR